MKKWIAFFSHTGTEIYNICRSIDRFPDLLITNNTLDSINKNLIESIDVTTVDSKLTGKDYSNILGSPNDVIVTLHGWMRIVPADVCDVYETYNLHPGLISRYPELKGKDPQHAAFSSRKHRYQDVGCVIHKVTPELDSGEIIMERSTPNTFYNFDELNSCLHKMAGEMWTYLLPDILK
jgi:folate-dependent phosphoribosylglycinamide formyltransferase PurN